MADQPIMPLHLRSDEDLAAALRMMGHEVAWPAAVAETGGPDVASLVRARLVREGARPAGGFRRPRGWHWTPARRALVLAIVALLALAAVAGAAGLGLPGLRIIFGGPSAAPASPSPSSGPPAIVGPSAAGPGSATSPPVTSAGSSGTAGPPVVGNRMGLGEQVSLAALDGRAAFAVRKPADPTIGPPDSAWVNPALSDQVSLIWASSDRLPPTEEPGVGLVLTEFRGAVDDGWFTKAIGPGSTVGPVRVGDQLGYWITGDPHQFFYDGPNGFVEDSRRWVGDVLLWADGPITYRLESSLGRDATIAIAESLQ